MSMLNDPRPSVDLEPRKYSDRLGVIDADQFQAVADEFGLGRVTNAEPAPGGLFGQVVFLTTTDGQYAMRGNPHGYVQLTKERRVAQIIRERSSLPAPWPYHVSEKTELFGWTYAVMPRLPGRSGSELWNAADDEQRLALARAFGEALGRLHEARSPFFGPYDADLDDFIAMDNFSDWALYRLDVTRTKCRRINALTVEAELFIDSMIDQCAGAFAVPFEPVLVHHDFTLGNVNLAESGRGYAATGVFDLFESYFGDGEEDLIRFLGHVQTDEQRRVFADAYSAHRSLRPGASERLALYALADFLVAWEYGKRNRVWFEDVAFLDAVRPNIANARAIGSIHGR
ncbi:aminoglycoside phosphotransferase family protein [Actinopolymorpha sp. B9G3]|uniref:phosphotransferase family protein n=1 Tax=Actinopolymorpha sp. B9G3 TaxID=3158970 RepID=UPI0032D978FD